MPVQKFKTFEEAEEALWLDSDDPTLTRRIDLHWRRSSQWLPPAMPRGVFKFRTIEEANASREAYEDARVETMRAEREAK
jgi:hypothetical protein